MGASQSYKGLNADALEDYATLTYLNKGEILHLLKKFYSIDPIKMQEDFHHRFTREEVITKFNTLKVNPFQDRLFRVFSSKDDDCLSFEDLLDMCSAMSSECPPLVKAVWAFRVFDLDDDNQISAQDLNGVIDRLTLDPSDSTMILDEESKSKIANVILNEINLDTSGSIGLSEFKMITTRLPEFESSFYFQL